MDFTFELLLVRAREHLKPQDHVIRFLRVEIRKLNGFGDQTFFCAPTLFAERSMCATRISGCSYPVWDETVSVLSGAARLRQRGNAVSEKRDSRWNWGAEA